MNRIVRIPTARTTVLAVATALALLGLTACSGAEEEAAAQQAERETRLQELEQQQQELQAARQELADLAERVALAEGGELPEGETVDPTALRVEIEQKDAQLTTTATDFNQALADFINADPPVEGEPTPPLTERAIAIKADEDIALAQEYITKGGDYARAIAIYDDVLAYAPDNVNAREAKAEAERLRYIDEERFSQIEKGMTQSQVEQILGPANLRNRRTFEEQGLAAWYYPKSTEGDAAGVWFRQRDGLMEVYKVDFDAIDKSGGEEEGA